jgi:hypothetical protein
MESVQVNGEVTGQFAPGQREAIEAEAAETPAPEVPQTPEVTPEPEAQTEPTPAPQEAPAGLDQFTEEYAKTGALSDESFAALEKMGYPRHVVDQYIAGTKALAEQQANAIYSTVGGREAYDGMIEWAAENLPADEIEAFNAAVSSSDTKQASFAVKSLEARYRVANAGEPRFIAAGGRTASPSGYESVAQVVAAMSDPRYKNDDAYRDEVVRKIAASNVL